MLKIKSRFSFFLLSIAILLGCTVDFTLSDTGTDSGSDADSDSDTDTDIEIEPCFGNGSRYQDNCYLVVSEPATFFDAETACVAWGGHLASIGNSQENTYIQTIISDVVWIGLYNNSTVNTGITPPDNNTCLSMTTTIAPGGGRYAGDTTDPPYTDNFEKDSASEYYCESSANASDLFIPMQLDEAGSWMFALNMSDLGIDFDTPVFALFDDTGARDSSISCLGSTQHFCRSEEPYSQYLHLDVGNYIIAIDGNFSSHQGTFSFNVYQFTYIDAAPLTYQNWSAGEPDRAQETENCIQMTNLGQGTWSDKSCSFMYGYVCKRPL